MYKKIKLILILFMITCSASIGQIDGINQNRDFGQGFSIYFIAPAFVSGSESNLNPILRENGYPTLPQGSLNWGIGFNYRYNRWLASLDGLVANQTRSNPITNSRLARTAFTGNLTLAHYIVQRKFGASSYSLYPFAGISATETNLKLSKQSEGGDINDLLANPNNSFSMNHLFGGVLLGVGIDIHNLKIEDSPYLSFRIGKRIATETAPAWESRFTNISNSPTDSFQYWFIQLNIGGMWNW